MTSNLCKSAIGVFSVLCFSLLSQASTNSDVLTLDAALNEGLGKSPKVEIAHSQSEEAHWKKREALQGFLPTLTLVGQDIPQQNFMYLTVPFPGAGTVNFPQIVPSWIYTLSAQVPIFDGFANINNYQAASSGEDAAENDYRWTQFRTQKEITLQYYRSLGMQILQEVAEQNLKTIEDHWRDVLAFKKAGVSTNFDVLRVEVQVSEAKTELMNAQDNTAIAKQKLAELMGETSEPRKLAGQMPVMRPEFASSVSADSLSNRADLLGLQQRKQSLEYASTAASRFWSPKISFFGNYFYYNNLNTNFPDANSFRDAYQIGFNLTWVLFDGLGSIARSRESAEKKYQAEKGLRAAQLSATSDFEMWKRKFLYNCSVYKSRVSDVEKSAESVRLAKEGHRVGARTNTDILDAESELFRARAGVVNAQIGAIEALINLELTTGQSLLK